LKRIRSRKPPDEREFRIQKSKNREDRRGNLRYLRHMKKALEGRMRLENVRLSGDLA